MESITKNRQSPSTLRTMVARAYGADQVPDGDEGWASELGHGWFNVAYRIRLREGREVVLKIAPPSGVEVLAYERGAMGIELAALALIHEHTNVPVPRVEYADHSREVCDAAYFFMPFIDGENLGIIEDSLPVPEREAYLEALGAANRELNSIPGKAFGPLAGPGEASWRKVFTGMVEDVLGDGGRRGVVLGHPYDEVRAVLHEHAASLDEVVEPCFVEWDLFPGNVLVKDGAIACIIDHERAFYGDPLIEGCFNAAVLPRFGDPTAFMRGYGHAPLTETETTRRRLYSMHLALVMVIETVFRGHTDPGQYDWARGRLDEVMALFGRHPR
jgi:aminoglycoside phosphotransferase (APT) family kinase protein